MFDKASRIQYYDFGSAVFSLSLTDRLAYSGKQIKEIKSLYFFRKSIKTHVAGLNIY